MTKEVLAAQLDGFGYPFSVSRDLQSHAKAAGLVIVYGASDDLMELRGAITEEVSAWEGTEILLTRDGLFQDETCESQCRYFLQAKREAQRHGRTIKALWDPGDGYSWRYETAIPHVTFEIVEESEPYCRGIIFALSDVETLQNKEPTCPN